jgi:coenzyme F420-0:L-glutamate ligase/coenzyme F420-1:gamma-L-glutamate ligase
VITAQALAGLPEVRHGDDLAALIAAALPAGSPAPDDVLVVAHKVVSKAEGRTRRLSEVSVGDRARELASELGGKDPRHVQVVLDETREVRRAANGVLICVTHHGFVCANAGVDASNSTDDATVRSMSQSAAPGCTGSRTGAGSPMRADGS